MTQLTYIIRLSMALRITKPLIAAFLLISFLTQASYGAALCRNTFKLPIKTILTKDRHNSFQMRDTLLAKERGEPTAVVYLNSLTYHLEGIRRLKGIEVYTNRILGPAILEVLNNPHVSVVYPTNSPISRAEILHFATPFINEALHKNPARTKKSYIKDLMKRFQVVNVQPLKNTAILVEHLLADPIARGKIIALTAGRNAYIQPYIGTPLEVKTAIKLGLPMNASARVNQVFGNTKSGNHEIFREAGVPHPLSRINLESKKDVAKSIYKMWQTTGHIKYMIKLEESSSGKGNASFRLTATDIRTLKDSQPSEAITYLEKRIYQNSKPQGAFTSKEFWDIEFNAQNAVMVEQFIPRFREGVDPSPSVQFNIGLGGRVSIVSTHEQIFHPVNKQTFIGAQYPAKEKYRNKIVDYAIKVAEQLAKKGMIGHGGIDFIITRDGKIYAIEVNARMNGTTHSFFTAQGLQAKGSKGDFHSISTDNFESPSLKKFKSVEDLLEHPEIKPLIYDIQSGEGVTFHIMGAIPIGKIGFQAIARTPQKARRIYNKVSEILESQ